MGETQSLGADWRNSRMLGYQGESRRCMPQRQSGINGIRTQTGFPMAPAKWAAAVSTVISMSKWAKTAAVSSKSWSASPRFKKANFSGSSLHLGSAGTFLQADKLDVFQ